MKSLIEIILFFPLCLITTKIIYPENRSAWVEYQWPKEIAYSWHKEVGGNCVIWVDDDSSAVIAFDTHTRISH